MNCDELRDHYELYAMGLAEEPERSEIREHVARGCEVCMRELKQARALMAVIGGTREPAAPPRQLRNRILASVGAEPRRTIWWGPIWGATAVAAICAAFAAVYFHGREREYAVELLAAQEQVRNQTIDLTRLNEAFAILNGPETTEAVFGQGQAQPPKGKVFVNAAQGVLLIASNLPPAPAGRIYEMWLLPKAGNPAPAGLFQSRTDGTALYVRRGPVDLNATGAVAVTIENEGGAPQPTSQPLIVASLAAAQPLAR